MTSEGFFFLIMKFNFLLIFFKLNQNFYPVVAIISCFSFLLSEIYPYIPWKKFNFTTSCLASSWHLGANIYPLVILLDTPVR